jgi:c-di-GMP phosphodiesterase
MGTKSSTEILIELKNKRIQALLRENRRLRMLSERDFLTGLYNRNKLQKDLERYTELSYRYRIKFSVMMIDIDKFKDINDTRGHIVGDKVLKEVAQCLNRTIRKSDRAYRLSGDEFIVIFSHHKSKKEIIKRIREALENINISISIGHCGLENKCCTDILKIIDKKMFEEKRRK